MLKWKGSWSRRSRGAAIAAVAIVSAAVSVPWLAKLYIQYKYPFVKIDSASYCQWGLRFKGIHIDKRPAIDAVIDRVSVFVLDKRIVVDGGSANLSIQKKERGAERNHQDLMNDWVIDVSNISVKAVRDSVSISADGVEYHKNASQDWGAFKEANIRYGSYSAYVINGKIPRDLSAVDADELRVKYPLPFKIPSAKTDDDELVVKKVHVSNRDSTLNFTASDFSYNIFSGTELESYIEKSSSKITLAAKAFSIDHKWLANPATFRNIVLGFDYKEKSAVVFIGPSRVRLDIDVKNQSLSGSGQCSDWVYGLPDPLPDALKQVAKNYTGNMSISITVKPRPDFQLKENCSFRCSQSPIKDLFDPDGFDYTAYHPDGSTFVRRVGPNQKDWIPISNIPPQLALAVTTLEDPGFQSHRGILPLAIKNSLLANLQSGKFTRGGSTITMQLAKNLWLSRSKTLLRKADEAMLVFALESCLTKEKILEFYLNIVQFGPDLYGIGPAAEHYFRKMPSGLTVDESFYLAMILPRPERAPAPENGGIAQAQGLMKMLTRNGFMMEGIADE